MYSSYLQSNLEKLANHKRVVLLQSPIGAFFRDLADWLMAQNVVVFKINFNCGDEYFYPESRNNTFAYTDTVANFGDYFENFLTKHQIDAVICFGDNRPYHRIARNVCGRLPETAFWVFEEGYFRPYWITLEQDGVNAYSHLPRNADFFAEQFSQLKQQVYTPPPAVPTGFGRMAKLAMRYYWEMYFGRRKFQYYQHHRFHEIRHYLGMWLKSGMKRAYYFLSERSFIKKIEQGEFGRFFVLPLQVFNDSQVRIHSDFDSVREFLLYTLQSFADHAPDDTQILIKHHPMDRGFIDYRKDIQAFIAKNPKLIGRVRYVHDVPLPVFLRHGVGMVTMNSTSGLSALIHKMPVKVLGRAHYDMPELTDQQPLADFWHNPQPPNAELFEKYRLYHLNITQINGSFYSRVNLPAFRQPE